MLVDTYGLALVFALGFAEYGGVPIVSVPLLVAVGGLSRMDALTLPAVIVFAALGGLAADAMWFALARWRGSRVVGVACGLSSNPGSCVLNVEAKVERLGAPYILTAKFLPGAGNLIAAAAGLGNYRARAFLLLDAVALLLWASAYAGLGWIFADRVEGAIRVLESYRNWVLAVGGLLVMVGGLYRYSKVRRHGHGAAKQDHADTDADGGARGAA